MDTQRTASRSHWLSIVIALATCALAAGLLLHGCSASNDEPDLSASTPSETQSESQSATASDDEATMEVEVTISCDVTNHELYETSTVEVFEGANPIDALEATGADVIDDGGFVTSIGGLKNGEINSMSGWTYTVNGEEPTVGASSYTLEPNDKVIWEYYMGN